MRPSYDGHPRLVHNTCVRCLSPLMVALNVNQLKLLSTQGVDTHRKHSSESYNEARCPGRRMRTLTDSRIQGCHAVSNIVGANVSWQRLNTVFTVACRSPARSQETLPKG